MQLIGSGLLVDGGRYVEYFFFQQWNRVRVQGVWGGEEGGVEEGQVQGDVRWWERRRVQGFSYEVAL